jgi:hypothetical protein
MTLPNHSSLLPSWSQGAAAPQRHHSGTTAATRQKHGSNTESDTAVTAREWRGNRDAMISATARQGRDGLTGRPDRPCGRPQRLPRGLSQRDHLREQLASLE